jgi:hypothetical protein
MILASAVRKLSRSLGASGHDRELVIRRTVHHAAAGRDPGAV